MVVTAPGELLLTATDGESQALSLAPPLSAAAVVVLQPDDEPDAPLIRSAEERDEKLASSLPLSESLVFSYCMEGYMRG